MPPPPLTPTCTERTCAVEMLNADGVTVTVGVVLGGAFTVTVFDPVAKL